VIIEWLIELGIACAQWFLGLLPATDTAAGLIPTATNSIAPILAGAGAIGNWMPWEVLNMALAIVIGLYVALFAVKIFRQLFSHVPLFGGTG
jgi:hypothetical protein